MRQADGFDLDFDSIYYAFSFIIENITTETDRNLVDFLLRNGFYRILHFSNSSALLLVSKNTFRFL